MKDVKLNNNIKCCSSEQVEFGNTARDIILYKKIKELAVVVENKQDKFDFIKLIQPSGNLGRDIVGKLFTNKLIELEYNGCFYSFSKADESTLTYQALTADLNLLKIVTINIATGDYLVIEQSNEVLDNHIADQVIHVSQADRDRWNNINDGILTIQNNGTTVQTFSANQSSNVTANIIVPTKTSDLTNDSNFVISSDLAVFATKEYVEGSVASAISRVYKPQGTVTVDILNSLTITKEMNGYVYDISGTGTLTKGSVQVIEGDNIAIIWNEDLTDWKWDRLSSIVDLSNYATKTYVLEGLNKKVNHSSTTSGEYIYGIADGVDKVYPIQKQAISDSIVQRTGNGNIVVPLNPAADDCTTSKHYVDTEVSKKANQSDLVSVQTELNDKLNKVTGETTNTQVYVKNAEGGQAMVDVTSSAQPGTFVRRDANNLFDVAEPVSEVNPTTKKYVDNGLETKMNVFLEVSSFLNLPAVGTASTFYVTVDTNKLYRWTGSAYIEVGNSKVLTTNTPTKFRNYTQEVYNYPYMQSLASDGKYIFGIMSKWAEQGRDIVACSYDLNGNLIATKELNESATLEACCGLTVKDDKLIIFQNGGVEKSVTINADGTFGANWEIYTGFKFAEINSTTLLQDVVYSKNLDRLYVKPYDGTDTVYIYANDATATTNNTLLGTFKLKIIDGVNFTRMTITDNCVFANYTSNGIIYPVIAVYTIDGEYLYTSNISYTPEEASVGIDFPAGETFDVEHSNTQGILYINDSIYFTSISFSTGYLGHKSAIVKCALINDSKQLILGETGSTAYPGNKGKANADNIKHLQETKADITYVDNAIKQAITNILTEEF